MRFHKVWIIDDFLIRQHDIYGKIHFEIVGPGKIELTPFKVKRLLRFLQKIGKEKSGKNRTRNTRRNRKNRTAR